VSAYGIRNGEGSVKSNETPLVEKKQPAAVEPPAVTPMPKANSPRKPPLVATNPLSHTSPSQTANGNDNAQVGGSVTAGPCSNVQIGGSGNTATTNCIPPSRVMSDNNLAEFKDKLKDSQQGIIRVVLGGSSDDVMPLAQQICSAAKDAKWGYACPHGRNSIMGRQVEEEGLKCYSQDWGAPDALAFQKAAKAANLSCIYIPQAFDFGGIPIMGTSGVTIVIGRQPNHN